MDYSFNTDIGHFRQTNEDSVISLKNKNGDFLAVICDGMGGHLGGLYASSKTIELISKDFKEAPKFNNKKEIYSWIYNTVDEINRELFNKSAEDQNYKGMGTTFVCCLINENYKVYANIGDSRIYLLENKVFAQLSQDQTLVAALYNAGYISYEETISHPKHSMLLNALGTSPKLDIQINDFKLNKGTIFLCSDGLYNMVDDEIITRILCTKMSAEDKVKKLIDTANENGGQDNISVSIIEVSKND